MRRLHLATGLFNTTPSINSSHRCCVKFGDFPEDSPVRGVFFGFPGEVKFPCRVGWLSLIEGSSRKIGGHAYIQPTSRGNMLKRFLVFFILLAVLFTGCQQSKNSLVTLHGMMLVKDPINAMPAEDNAIYLVPLPSDQMVISVPSIPSDNAIQARVDNKTGEFVFSKISPGKYVIIVLTIYGGQIPAKMENGSMAVINVQESDLNKTVELNNLFVP
jgi:hypothetical protein